MARKVPPLTLSVQLRTMATEGGSTESTVTTSNAASDSDYTMSDALDTQSPPSTPTVPPLRVPAHATVQSPTMRPHTAPTLVRSPACGHQAEHFVRFGTRSDIAMCHRCGMAWLTTRSGPPPRCPSKKCVKLLGGMQTLTIEMHFGVFGYACVSCEKWVPLSKWDAYAKKKGLK
jgi:hypothetical protein